MVVRLGKFWIPLVWSLRNFRLWNPKGDSIRYLVVIYYLEMPCVGTYECCSGFAAVPNSKMVAAYA
jgi:hypothetical protein